MLNAIIFAVIIIAVFLAFGATIAYFANIFTWEM